MSGVSAFTGELRYPDGPGFRVEAKESQLLKRASKALGEKAAKATCGGRGRSRQGEGTIRKGRGEHITLRLGGKKRRKTMFAGKGKKTSSIHRQWGGVGCRIEKREGRDSPSLELMTGQGES